MANVNIEPIGASELELVAGLYSRVFKPVRDIQFFERRFQGRHNNLMLLALMEKEPVGFFMGFELKPSVYFAWLVGVLSDYRRAGVASQLMEAAEAWAVNHDYGSIRFECSNLHRPMLHMGVRHQYDIVGIRWDPDLQANLVIFEKVIGESA